MSRSLRIALVVPNDKYEFENERHCRLKALRSACKAGDIDLVVFPEGYRRDEDRDGIQTVADEWADRLGVPSIVGVGTGDGFQAAVYRNPTPAAGDTTSHVYVKHSTSDKVAFQWVDDQRKRQAMFEPIVLKGRKIAVQICHDMFFGLIGQRMRKAGADVFIDITGGGVNLRKWTNVIQGRSLELTSPFLCTMAKRGNDGSGASQAIAFHSGRCLKAGTRNVGSKGFGGYEVYTLPAGLFPGEGELAPDDQAFTDKRYGDITVAVDSPKSADVQIESSSGAVRVGKKQVVPSSAWCGLEKPVGRVGVLALPLSALSDGLALYKRIPEQGAFSHHVVTYCAAEASDSFEDLLALAKLRAIEHRIAVVLVAGGHRAVLKTNRYKNIQRFKEADGVFGLNAEFLGGTWSTASSTPRMGIPEEFFPSYLSLAT